MGSAWSILKRFFNGEVPASNPTMDDIEEELRKQSEARAKAEQKAEQESRRREEMAEELRKHAERAKQAETAREKAERDAARAGKEKEAETAARKKAEQDAARARKEREAQTAARKKAEQEAARANKESEDVSRKWRKGIQPVVWPTEEEYHGALKTHQYKEGYFHFAVAGGAGSGKSSLVNAFRGVTDGTKDAAATGVTETTLEIGRYPDPRPDYPFVWYDIPGAGTLEVPRTEYFNREGLFIFDCIIVLWDKRFTDTDIAILDNCTQFNIPCFIVRSNSDTHIDNLVKNMKERIEEDKGIEEDEKERLIDAVYSEALAEYCAKSRQSVEENLRKAGLPPKRVYLVSSSTLRKVIKRSMLGSKDQDVIHEVSLIRDILVTADLRRCIPHQSVFKSSANLLTGGINALSNVANAVTRWGKPDEEDLGAGEAHDIGHLGYY